MLQLSNVCLSILQQSVGVSGEVDQLPVLLKVPLVPIRHAVAMHPEAVTQEVRHVCVNKKHIMSFSYKHRRHSKRYN